MRAGIWAVVNLNYNAGEHKISYSVANIQNYKKLEYKLTYDTDTLPRGDSGNVDLSYESEKHWETVTGTDSSGDFVYYNRHRVYFRLGD